MAENKLLLAALDQAEERKKAAEVFKDKNDFLSAKKQYVEAATVLAKYLTSVSSGNSSSPAPKEALLASVKDTMRNLIEKGEECVQLGKIKELDAIMGRTNSLPVQNSGSSPSNASGSDTTNSTPSTVASLGMNQNFSPPPRQNANLVAGPSNTNGSKSQPIMNATGTMGLKSKPLSALEVEIIGQSSKFQTSQGGANANTVAVFKPWDDAIDGKPTQNNGSSTGSKLWLDPLGMLSFDSTETTVNNLKPSGTNTSGTLAVVDPKKGGPNVVIDPNAGGDAFRKTFSHWVRLTSVAGSDEPEADIWRSYGNLSGGGPGSDSGAALVTQGHIGNCSFITAVCSILHWEYRFNRSLLTKPALGHIKQDSPRGKFSTRFFINGYWRKVEVDDLVPVNRRNDLLTVTLKNGAKWLTLYEKAFLKIKGGTYGFNGSIAAFDIYEMTGWPPELIVLREKYAYLGVNNSKSADSYSIEGLNRIWDEILYPPHAGFRNGDCLMSAGCGKTEAFEGVDEEALSKKLGLVTGHSYAILELVEVKREGTSDNRVHRLLLLKNPWSSFQWTGKWSAFDNINWTPRLKQLLRYDIFYGSTHKTAGTNTSSHNDGSKGLFWIELDDFYKYFSKISVNWNLDLFKLSGSPPLTLHHFISTGTDKRRFRDGIWECPQFEIRIQYEVPAGLVEKFKMMLESFKSKGKTSLTNKLRLTPDELRQISGGGCFWLVLTQHSRDFRLEYDAIPDCYTYITEIENSNAENPSASSNLVAENLNKWFKHCPKRLFREPDRCHELHEKYENEKFFTTRNVGYWHGSCVVNLNKNQEYLREKVLKILTQPGGKSKTSNNKIILERSFNVTVDRRYIAEIFEERKAAIKKATRMNVPALPRVPSNSGDMNNTMWSLEDYKKNNICLRTNFTLQLFSTVPVTYFEPIPEVLNSNSSSSSSPTSTSYNVFGALNFGNFSTTFSGGSGNLSGGFSTMNSKSHDAIFFPQYRIEIIDINSNSKALLLESFLEELRISLFCPCQNADSEAFNSKRSVFSELEEQSDENLISKSDFDLKPRVSVYRDPAGMSTLSEGGGGPSSSSQRSRRYSSAELHHVPCKDRPLILTYKYRSQYQCNLDPTGTTASKLKSVIVCVKCNTDIPFLTKKKSQIPYEMVVESGNANTGRFRLQITELL